MLKQSLDVVTNLTPLRSWHWKFSFAGALINFELLFLNMPQGVEFWIYGF